MTDACAPTGDRGRGALQDASRILGLSFLPNWMWEATHAAAYVKSAGPFLYRVRHCLPMAATDALWTLAIWVTATAMWRADRREPRLAPLGVLGAVTAIAVERVALAEGRRTYNALLPILPVVGVGVWPVAQMVVLPVITVWLRVRARPTCARASDPPVRLA